MIERLQWGNYIPQQATSQEKNTSTSFSQLLRERMENVGSMPTSSSNNEIQFSKHAQQRAEQRGIEISSDLLAQLTNSVQRAQEKGAKNILAFDAGRAFIINVAQNRVVTAISQDEMQDNVFTNIDGAVLLK